jgi:hypothetical protein
MFVYLAVLLHLHFDQLLLQTIVCSVLQDISVICRLGLDLVLQIWRFGFLHLADSSFKG